MDIAVTAVELDETTAACATMNLMPFPHATVVHADATSVDLAGIDGVWLDPARRTTTTSGHQPALGSGGLLPAAVLRGIPGRLGAGRGREDGSGHPARVGAGDCEAQWVSVDGDVVEAALWFNAVARPGVRRAALVIGPQRRAELTSAVPYDPGGQDVAIGPGGGLPLRARRRRDPRRAGGRPGLRSWAGTCWMQHIAYICAADSGGHPVCPRLQGPGGQPYNVKALKPGSGRTGIGVLDIKKRGTAVTPEDLRKQLLTGWQGARAANNQPPWS